MNSGKYRTVIERRLPFVTGLLLLMYFWANGVAGLDRFPKIHQDESLLVAPGCSFWETGVFGTELFTGFYGTEKHLYSFMPVFPLLAGASLHVFGVGLFQARLTSLILTMLVLALTCRLGAALFSRWHGAAAAAILVIWPIAAPRGHLASGVPLADVARIARYDSAVPVFTLAALLLFTVTVRKRESRILARNFLIAGALVGLATLSHLYGVFILAGIFLAVFWIWGRRALLLTVAAANSFLLALLPWLVFVASGWRDFLGQYRGYGERLSLLDTHFYLSNLSHEFERYQPVLDGVRLHIASGLWLIVGAIGLFWLFWRALFRKEAAARILLASLGSGVVLFALLLNFKTFSYLAMLWPLFALVVAAGLGVCASIRHARLIVVALFALAMVEGISSSLHLRYEAEKTTPYATFTTMIADQLPPDSRVLAMHHYWLGLVDHTAHYQSILAPILWTNAKYVEKPLSFGAAAALTNPDVVLLDQVMLDFLSETARPDSEYHTLGRQIWGYLADQYALLIAEIRDPTYGLIKIYQLQKAFS